jgi:mRNA interferase MazF
MSHPKLAKNNSWPKRGEVWWANFDPSIGTESAKTRPAVIVSNDVSNRFLERIQVVPLTSNVTRIYPSETVVTLRGKKNKAAADQITTVSKRRVYKKAGTLSAEDLADVEYVLKLQLGF